jgi:nucleoside-diphosphate-sugar epimerase
MTEERIHLFVLGATGFVGGEVVKQALAQGLAVTALARSAERASGLLAMGARVVLGDARSPENWIQEAAGCDVIVDLLQPELPARVGLRTIRRVAAARASMTSRLITALESIPDERRPLLLSVSGLDDLAPDERGNVDDRSAQSTEFSGFAHIGVPVRRLIEASGVAWAYAYLGTVYGPGKSFAKKIFPQLASGRLRLPGTGANRMAVVHVEDAARALVHIATLERGRVSGRSFVIADGHPTAMADFMGFAAECLGGPRPKSAPLALVRVLAGQALFETMTRDIAAHPTALTETRFEFRYPTYRLGLPPSIQRLGHPAAISTIGILDRRIVFLALLVLAIGAFLAENLLSFPLSVPYMKGLSAGAPILDMRPGYTANAAYQLFDVLGRSGRAAYLTLLCTIDLVLPALFGLFLSAAIRRGAFRNWHSVPLLATVCDYAENVAIAILLLRYPEHHPVGVSIAATFTILKLALYGAGVLLSTGGVVARFLKRASNNSDHGLSRAICGRRTA